MRRPHVLSRHGNIPSKTHAEMRRRGGVGNWVIGGLGDWWIGFGSRRGAERQRARRVFWSCDFARGIAEDLGLGDWWIGGLGEWWIGNLLDFLGLL